VFAHTTTAACTEIRTELAELGPADPRSGNDMLTACGVELCRAEATACLASRMLFALALDSKRSSCFVRAVSRASSASCTRNRSFSSSISLACAADVPALAAVASSLGPYITHNTMRMHKSKSTCIFVGEWAQLRRTQSCGMEERALIVTTHTQSSQSFWA
jgi:hypothetical protein